jgi:hypothetical protein
LTSFACGGGKETDTEKLVPEGSSLIGSIQVEKILNDVDLESIYRALPVDEGDPQTIDQLLAEATEQTGVDIRKISHATFFADISRPGEFLGIIVRGSFDEDAVVAAFQKAGQASLKETKYKGRRIHASEDDSDQGALVVLDGENLVLGTLEAVQAVIDVQDGDRSRSSEELRDAFGDLEDGLIRLVLEVPPGVLQDQLPLGDIPLLGESVEDLPAILGAFQDLALVGLSLDLDGQDLKLRVTLDFGSADSATAFGDFLDGILKLATGASPDAQTRELVERLQIKVDGDGVAISLEIAVPELSQLFGDLVGVSSAETSAAVPPAKPGSEPAYRIVTMPTANHVPDGDIVVYNTTPPTSVDHLAGWADCGFYPGGLPDELIVHNLEHSNIVVSYNLPAGDDVERLRGVMGSLGLAADWGVTRSYDKIPAGTVALAAWGRLDTVQGVDRGKISRFFDAYADALGPERIPC